MTPCFFLVEQFYGGCDVGSVSGCQCSIEFSKHFKGSWRAPSVAQIIYFITTKDKAKRDKILDGERGGKGGSLGWPFPCLLDERVRVLCGT